MGDRNKEDFDGIFRNPSKIARFVSDRIDSKLLWFKKNSGKFNLSKYRAWQDKVLEVIYEGYLGLKFPDDGRIVCKEGNMLILEWKCKCPVLEACKETGWHTSHVCSTLYHCQWQALLSLVEPNAFFARDYSKLRPQGDACIEVIVRRPGFIDLQREHNKDPDNV